MKIREAIVDNRKAQIALVLKSGKVYPIPFSKLEPRPTPGNRIFTVAVDKDLASEAVTYVLESGAKGTLHVEQALEYNQDPKYLADLLAHKLTVEAMRRVDRAGLSRRELARRLRTSVPQLYRLLDPANTRKNLGQLVGLLHLLDCDVDVVVTPNETGKAAA